MRVEEHVTEKTFYWLVETLKIHGQIEYGTDEIDVDALINFLNSDRNKVRFLLNNCSNEEQVEKVILQDILDGAPVWTFFKLSRWTKKMCEKEWKEFCEEEKKRAEKELEENKKKYKCLTCCNYEHGETSFGTYVRCKATGLGGDCFKLKQRCAQYNKEVGSWLTRRGAAGRNFTNGYKNNT